MITEKFKAGFEKTSSPVLTDIQFGMGRSEYNDDKQAILEKNTEPGSKAKKKDGHKDRPS